MTTTPDPTLAARAAELRIAALNLAEYGTFDRSPMDLSKLILDVLTERERMVEALMPFAECEDPMDLCDADWQRARSALPREEGRDG